MNWIFSILPAVFLLVYLRWVSPVRILRRLGARPVNTAPDWGPFRQRLDAAARAQRVTMPGIWVLPEYSPNALILRSSGRIQLAVTEGLVRALSEEELDAALALCLAHGKGRGRRWQTWVSTFFFPVAGALQSYPLPLQLLLGPILSAFLGLVARPRFFYRADQAAALFCNGWRIAATLQKLSVMGKKIPLARWNMALDSLFLVSPLSLDETPIYSFSGQPSPAKRRERLLQWSACESAPSLP